VKILVAYGTTEGQTRKIAEFVAEHLREAGNDVQLHDSARLALGLKVGDADVVVVAASVHLKVHQESIANFVFAHEDQLRLKPSLFLSVSLSAAFDEGKTDAKAYADQFVAEAGWEPTRTILVAGALRYSEYDYFKEQIIQHLVLKGREISVSTGDYEFTDWDDLSRQIADFMRTVAGLDSQRT
jgi:menaquinone-dependent protoporphyrinogen oxidase